MEEEDAYRRLCHDAMDLIVSIGLIDSVSARWPGDVQESWRERMKGLGEQFQRETSDCIEFASAYDE